VDVVVDVDVIVNVIVVGRFGCGSAALCLLVDLLIGRPADLLPDDR
jgi:hypothetical protein